MKRILLTLALFCAASARANKLFPDFNFGVFPKKRVAEILAAEILAAEKAKQIGLTQGAEGVLNSASGSQQTAFDCKNLLGSAQENLLSLLAKASNMAQEFITSNEPGVVKSRNSLIAVAVLVACYGSYKFYNYVTTPKK